jgi:MoaA/NifB/PqqE/SkfB family radical SAM enzyme
MRSPLLRLSVSYLKNILANQIYFNTGIDLTKPIHLHAQLNYKCNSQCSMCDSWSKGLQDFEELPATKWNETLGELKTLSPNIKVSFAGGEILLKKDIFDIFQYCNDNNILYGIITNGLLLNEKNIKKLLYLKPYNIHVSFDSLNDDGYEKMRGIRGLFTLKKNIIALTQIIHDTNSNAKITLKPTVCDINLGELDDIVRFADKHNVHGVTFQPIVGITEEAKKFFIHDLDKLKNMIGKLSSMRKEGYPILNSVENMESWVEYFNLLRTSSPSVNKVNNNGHCVIPLNNVYIRSSGEIKLCELYDLSLGNIKTDSISSVLQSGVAKEQKKTLIHCKRNCVYCIKRSLKDYVSITTQFVKPKS